MRETMVEIIGIMGLFNRYNHGVDLVHLEFIIGDIKEMIFRGVKFYLLCLVIVVMIYLSNLRLTI